MRVDQGRWEGQSIEGGCGWVAGIVRKYVKRIRGLAWTSAGKGKQRASESCHV